MSAINRFPSLLRRLVWNADEDRPRAPWRLLGATLLFVGVTLVAVLVAFVAGVGLSGTAVGSGSLGTAVGLLLPGVIIVVAVALAGWLLDRRRFRDFGLRLDRAWWRDLGFGLALGALLMTLVFAAEYALGWVRVTGYVVADDGAFASQFALGVVLFLAVGFYEELMARGYLLKNVAEGLDGYVGRVGATAVAVLVSSAIFGALHAGNPNATLLSTLNIGLAGVMLAAGYVMTGELAIPIGLHITWNAFQGLVYGFPVSGNDFGAALVGIEQGGPTLITGGQFGPEAGLVGLAAMALGTLLTVAWARWHGHVGIDYRVTRPELRQ